MGRIVRKSEIESSLVERSHPLNGAVKRSTVSLGDLTGLSQVGLHFTVLKPGDTSTELHWHRLADEFVFILSGEGVLQLDKEEHKVSGGDFIGLPKMGPGHKLSNRSQGDLVYLVGGTRAVFDICEYPDLSKRLYFYREGERIGRDFVDIEDVESK